MSNLGSGSGEAVTRSLQYGLRPASTMARSFQHKCPPANGIGFNLSNNRVSVIEIPTRPSTFLQPEQSYLELEVTVELDAGTVNGLEGPIRLDQTAASLIDSITVSHGTVNLETIEGYNVLTALLVDAQCSEQHRTGLLAMNQGHRADLEMINPLDDQEGTPDASTFKDQLGLTMELSSTALDDSANPPEDVNDGSVVMSGLAGTAAGMFTHALDRTADVELQTQQPGMCGKILIQPDVTGTTVNGATVTQKKTRKHKFMIPLSLSGVLGSATGKYIPLAAMTAAPLTLEIRWANVDDACVRTGLKTLPVVGTNGQQPSTYLGSLEDNALTIKCDKLHYVAQIIELQQSVADSILDAAIQQGGGMIKISTQCYRHHQSSWTKGNNSVTTQIPARLSSVVDIFMTFRLTDNITQPRTPYAGTVSQRVNPQFESAFFRFGPHVAPQRPIETSEDFLEQALMCFNGTANLGHTSSLKSCWWDGLCRTGTRAEWRRASVGGKDGKRLPCRSEADQYKYVLKQDAGVGELEDVTGVLAADLKIGSNGAGSAAATVASEVARGVVKRQIYGPKVRGHSQFFVGFNTSSQPLRDDIVDSGLNTLSQSVFFHGQSYELQPRNLTVDTWVAHDACLLIGQGTATMIM